MQAQTPAPQDTVTLMPPEDDVVFGLWRAEALVTGDRITKVAFSVDDKVQYARHSAPYTVELRLKRLPAEQVVRVDGYDAQGQAVASDQLILNQPHGGLAVSILATALRRAAERPGAGGGRGDRPFREARWKPSSSASTTWWRRS